MITANLEKLQILLKADQIKDTAETAHPYGNSGAMTVFPNNENEIVAILKFATENSFTVNIMGAGTKRGYGGMNERADILLSLEKYTGIVEHHPGDMTITVKAGTPFQEIQDHLKAYSQRIALDPFLPEQTTIGGLVSSNDSGPKRLGYGAARDAVIGLRMIYPDGTIIRSGGKVVKNVAGYDMNKLFIGSMGTIGVISEVTIKLRPITKAESTMIISFPISDMGSIKNLSVRVLDSTIEPVCFELINPELMERMTGEKSYSLVMSFEDVEKSVSYQEEFIQGLMKDGIKLRRLKGEESVQFWQSFYHLLPNGNKVDSQFRSETVLKIGTINMNILSILKDCELIQDTNNVTIQAHGGLGHGIMNMYINGVANDVRDAIEKVRNIAQKHQGYAIIRHLPFEQRKQTDIWGPKPAAFFLFEGIKLKVDPNRILNRNRYIGGI
ncbi:FAD-binding oxidoreductase [Cytobacillus purgationiresistens]|uniref:Glycolate oxidase FAD binding subunit n=1 Tax=Cytobacillus purgationiresistens TaxID=863449 RepID=A0ABU0AM35_9BACI|nr:FAD-binding oxidoreductase [Cytobacillus purgationiresistens]MDQ0272322.1 glycolate oxidase FAD binding subunit [Cytobacillus purgationiresistens]